MDDFEAVIEQLKKELGEDKITTTNRIPRPQQALDREMFEDFNERNPMAGGSMLVQPSADGSRPGYKGPKKDSSVIAKKIEEVNKGFKFYTYDSLAKEIKGFNSGNNLQIYIKNNNLPKLESFNKKVEKSWISLFENGDNKASTVFKPLIKIREMVGGGQKDYGSGKTKRTRTEHISKALKKSDLLVWDDIKPLINRLSNQNFINSLNRKGGDYTITDVEYSTYNKSGMLRAPKTDAEHLIDYVIRHVNQSDKPIYSIYDSKTNKRITDLNNVESYHDIYFKSESPFQDNTKYDMDYLKTKARKDPLFKEYFNLQDQLFEMKNRKFWPDGSRIIDPKTGKGTTFGKWSGSLYKEGYGYTKSFERFPYDTDHKFGVGKHPFKDLAILPQRINIALGSVKQKNRGDLSKKIGAEFFRNLSVDDLMMQEKDLGNKILIFDKQGNHIGKKLETPYQNAKRMVKYYNDLDLFEAGRGPQPEFPLSEFQKPDQAIPIKQRLETFKKDKLNIRKPVGTDGPRLGALDVPSMFKKLSPATRKLVGFGGGTILPEVLFYQLDKANRMSKGVSEKEAAAGALESGTLGAYTDKAYMEELKKVAESMNIDSSAFDSAYQLNVLSKNFEQNSKNVDAQMATALENQDIKTAEELRKNFNKYVARIKPEAERLRNDIEERVTGGSPLTMAMGRGNVTDEQYSKPFYDMQDVALEKLKKEKQKAFNTQKRQVDTAAGSIGEGFYQAFDSLTQGAKNLLKGRIIPFGPDRLRPLESDREREARYLKEMDPRELFLYNKARGYTYDNPITEADLMNLQMEQPGLFAGGGIAGLSGGIDKGAQRRSMNPDSQGLKGLFNRAMKIEE